MSTNPINHLSNSTDLESLIAIQAADQNSKNSSGSDQMSAFAQMLGAAGESNANPKENSAGNPSQLLNQLVASYQKTSVENQGQSLDPSSIGS
jgi:hypothetical protein